MPTYFQHFSTSIKGIELPKKFTFPFYYEPHLLSEIAVKEVQDYLESQTDFQHNFGIDPSKKGIPIGKMFGVLIVKHSNNEIGYITAVSGKLANKNIHKKFVPPVFDMLTKNSFFIEEERTLNSLTKSIENLQQNSEFISLTALLKSEKKRAAIDINEKKKEYKAAKKARSEKRKLANDTLSTEEFNILKNELAKESLESKYFLNNVKRYWEHSLHEIQKKISIYTDKLAKLTNERTTKSAALQRYLFDQYQFLNAKMETKKLSDLFATNALDNPPAGAGECAAPKLLQFAYLNRLTPLAMAEFWWGISPNTEIRKHKQFYPACQGKCKPILSHMLDGLNVDSNPMLQNPAIGKELEYLYEDADILIVNKPPEFLSVPGIHIQDSVYTRVKQQFPNISGPIIVHRLDMSTSGLLVVAKNKIAHKILQSQFIHKTVKKQYVAIIDGIITTKKGTVDIPLRVDINDRPRQLVCFEHGKPALTSWEVVERAKHRTRMHLFPVTGRTHQLRVHMAHPLGLNTPIVGDDLYGTKDTRLHLHAAKIEFTHPTSKEKMSFYKKEPF